MTEREASSVGAPNRGRGLRRSGSWRPWVGGRCVRECRAELLTVRVLVCPVPSRAAPPHTHTHPSLFHFGPLNPPSLPRPQTRGNGEHIRHGDRWQQRQCGASGNGGAATSISRQGPGCAPGEGGGGDGQAHRAHPPLCANGTPAGTTMPTGKPQIRERALGMDGTAAPSWALRSGPRPQDPIQQGGICRFTARQGGWWNGNAVTELRQ